MVKIACNFPLDCREKLLVTSATVRMLRSDKCEIKKHKGLSVFTNPHQCKGHILSLCVQTVSSAARSVSSSDTDSQHWTSAEGKLLFLPLSPHPTLLAPFLFCLCSSHPLLHPATFIILSSLDHSSRFIISACFSLRLSLALTSLQHCSAGEDSSTHFPSLFLPTCKVYNSNPKASSFHGRTHLFTRHT